MRAHIKQEYTGVPNKRKALVKSNPMEYPIYGLFYKDGPGTDAIAAIAAENDKEAISMLEKVFSQAEMNFLRFPLDTIAEDTGYKTSKKGIIYAYDSITRKVF